MGMTKTATRLIKRFGQEAILRKPGEEASTPWEAEANGPAASTDHAVTIAVTEYSIEELAASLISGSDLRVFMTAGVKPETADQLLIGGEVYRIHRVGILGPNGTTICFELQVRK